MIKLLAFFALIGIVAWLAMRAMKPGPGMPRAEAARLLGLEVSAGNDAVLDAHRRLISRVHPDTGGSAELAARINEARDIMLKR